MLIVPAAWYAFGWPYGIGAFILLGMIATLFEDNKEKTEPAKRRPTETAKAEDVADKIEEICVRSAQECFFSSSAVPQGLMESAYKYYRPPGGGVIYGLLDTSTSKSAISGLAIGAKGIGWRSGVPSEPAIGGLTWAQFNNREIEVVDSNILKIGSNSAVDFSTCDFSAEKFVSVLEELRAVTRGIKEPRPRPAKEPRPRDTKKPSPMNPPAPPPGKPSDIINVNSANLDDLIRLPGIGVPDARAIIEARKTGPIQTVDELAEFLELKPHIKMRIARLVSFEGRPLGGALDNPDEPEAGNGESPPEIGGGREID